MIKKTLRNSVVGTAVAGALILPAATTVAPQLQLMACDYPNSVFTTTDVDAPAAVRPGEAVPVSVVVEAAEGEPNGKLIVTITGPSGKRVREKDKGVGDGEREFLFAGFKLGKNQDAKTYKVTARFIGTCKFQNSSDSVYFTVQRG